MFRQFNRMQEFPSLSYRLTGLWMLLGITIGSVLVIAYSVDLMKPQRRSLLYTLSILQLIMASAAYVALSGRSLLRDITVRRLTLDLSVVATVVALILAIVVGLTERQFGLTGASRQELLGQFFYYLVLIGLTEELLFRALPFSVLPTQPAWAVFVGSCLFSLYHFNNGPETLPYYLAFGLVFGVLRYFSVSLVALALGHGVFNFILVAIWPSVGFRFGEANFVIVSPWMLLAVAAFSGWVLDGLRARPSPASSNTKTRQSRAKGSGLPSQQHKDSRS